MLTAAVTSPLGEPIRAYRGESAGVAVGIVKGVSDQETSGPVNRLRNVVTGVEVDFSEDALAQAQAFRDSGRKSIEGDTELSEEEERQVRALERRDAEVRRHERAHVAAGGPYVRGGANFEYVTGPDGRRYATGGDVNIDVGRERTPEATIRKMQVVRRAAMAPEQPSAQDRQVAAQASTTEAEARAELAKEAREEQLESAETPDTTASEALAEGTPPTYP